MDVLTHLLLPYVAALVVLGLHRAPRGVGDVARRQTLIAYAAVFGIAGFTPDLDSGFSWMRHFGGLYFLQHRGISHTLLFSPVLAVASLAALHGLARWRPARFGRFHFRWGFVPVAVVGSWTHLVLDGLTYAGVPLLWPLSFDRVAFGPFHWLVIWLFPLAAVALGLHVWGKLDTRHMAWVGAVFVVVLLLLAGVRVHYRPEAGPDEVVFSRNDPREWVVARQVGDDWHVRLVRSGVTVDATWYNASRDPGTDGAVARAHSTNDHAGFRMGAVGPVVVQAEDLGADGILVTFIDVAARFEAEHDPRWTPTRPVEAWGFVAFLVTDDGVAVRHRGW